jgi:hypothetical protein
MNYDFNRFCVTCRPGAVVKALSPQQPRGFRPMQSDHGRIGRRAVTWCVGKLANGNGEGRGISRHSNQAAKAGLQVRRIVLDAIDRLPSPMSFGTIVGLNARM